MCIAFKKRRFFRYSWPKGVQACALFYLHLSFTKRFMDIVANLASLSRQLPGGVKLVAVSKTHPVEDILEAYNAGQKIFGENKAQELASKAAQLPPDIEWHFIGHLQTNKVRLIASFVNTIESVESLKLLSVVDKEAHRAGRTINCLLQFHIAMEETKFGLDLEEAKALLSSHEYEAMEHVRITGVMGMATFTDNVGLVRKEFRMLGDYFDVIRRSYFHDNSSFCEISMGMSGDYELAIEEGSTIVRIGSAIFGER
jgi:PLP dependent protein